MPWCSRRLRGRPLLSQRNAHPTGYVHRSPPQNGRSSSSGIDAAIGRGRTPGDGASARAGRGAGRGTDERVRQKRQLSLPAEDERVSAVDCLLEHWTPITAATTGGGKAPA